MTGAWADNLNRTFARAISSSSRSVARAGIWRMRGGCPSPVVNPSFHVRSPSSNASNNVGATATNAGETLNQGLEGALGYDLGAGWGVDANATWVPTAEYDCTKIVDGIDRNGNRLPYAPEVTANLSVSYSVGGLRTSLSAYHVSHQFVDPENTEVESADGRRGEIPAYTTLDLNARYDFDKQLGVFGTVRNLADRKYIVSRNPDGIFPGAERNFEIGMSYKF